MTPKQLLIATHNPAKKQELKEGFSSLIKFGTELLSLDELHIMDDPEETGKTFLENAQLKANFFSRLSGLPTVADDGGIEIDVLDGEPGVHSKRWLGRDATDEEMVTYTLERLKGVPQEKRTAQFTVCLFYKDPITGFKKSVTKSIKGHISFVPSGRAVKGYPYRSLFIVDAYDKFYDELTELEHRAVNHRLNAVQELIKRI